MGMPAARVTDPHVCPMVTVLVPHVGGIILPPGALTVLIGGLPAARVTDKATCVGPPDMIAVGSSTVFTMGMAQARLGACRVQAGLISVHIMLPVFPLVNVRETEFPVLVRLIDAREESLSLFFLGNVEKEFDGPRSVPIQVGFEIHDRTIPLIDRKSTRLNSSHL